MSSSRSTKGLPPGVSVGATGPRLLAALVEVGPVWLLTGLALLFGFVLDGRTVIAVVFLLLAAVWAILVWAQRATKAAGVGMRLDSLQIVGFNDGRPIGWSRVLIRWLVFAGLTVSVVGLIAMAVAMARHPRRQGWHDLAANAVVIKERPLAPPRPRPAVVRSSNPAAGGRSTAGAPQRRKPAGPRSPAPSRPPAGRKPSAAPQAKAPHAKAAQSAASVVIDQAATDQAATDQTATDQTATDQTVTDQAATDQAATDQTATDQTATDQAVTDQAATDQAATDQAATDQVEPDDAQAGDQPADRPDYEWWLRLDDGRDVGVERLVLLGRNPQPRVGEEDATLIKVLDETRTVSKSHLAVGVDAGGLYVMDRGSTNGTTVTAPDGGQRPCPPGDLIDVPDGSVVSFGDHWLEVRRPGR